MEPSETLRECARKLAARPGDPEAVVVLEKLLETPDRVEAARFLIAAYQRTQNHAGLVRALDTLARSTPDRSERMSALERLSDVYRRNLDRPDLALAALTQALEQTPADAALHRLALNVAVDTRAEASLSAGLAGLLERNTGSARLVLLKQLAALEERKPIAASQAAVHLEAVLEVAPGDLEAIDALRRHHEKKNDFAALARVTERLGRFAPDAPAQLAAWRAAGRLYRDRVRDDERALDCWVKVLELAPADDEALQALEKTSAVLNRLAVFAQALERARAAASGAQKWDLGVRLAALKAHKLGDLDAAVALCREVLAADPGHAAARALLRELVNPTEELLAALKTLHDPVQRSALLPGLRALALEADALEEVTQAVEDESEEVDDPAGLAALLRFAALAREELGHAPKATVLWNDLLAARPDDPEALEHLSRLLATANDEKRAAEVALRRAKLAENSRERLRWTADAAERFIAGSMPEAAIAALDEALAAAPADAPERGRAQLLRGRVLEGQGQLAAVTAYTQALQTSGLEADAIAGLERLMMQLETRLPAARAVEPALRQLGDPRRLAAALDAQLEATESPEQQAVKLSEVAQLWEAAKEPRVALGARLRLFALRASDEQARVELERLALSLGAQDELAAAYEERLELEPQKRRALFARRLAELLDSLGERDRAFAAWAIAAEAASTDLELVRAFVEKAKGRGDLRQLARAMSWQAAAMPDSPARTDLWRKLANLYEDGLSDLAGAARAYEKLLEKASDDRALLKSLARLYEQLHDDAALARVLERELAVSKRLGLSDAVPLSLRLAKLKLAPPKDEAGALQLLREVLRLEPTNAHAVATIAQLASVAGPHQAEAAKLATTALDKLGDFPVVVQILESQLSVQASTRERAAILSQIAELHAGPLKDPELAFLAITRALREAPSDPAILARCATLAEAAGTGADLEDLLGELARVQPPGAGRAALMRGLAERQEARGAIDDAVHSWLDAAAQAPGDAAIREHLTALLEKTKRYGDLVSLAQHQLDGAAPEQKPAALAALAAAKERAGQLDEAASTLLSLFALTQSREALLSLERVLGRQGRHSERAETLRRLAELSPDPKQRVDYLVQQARALVAGAESELAVVVFAQVLDRDPAEPRAIADLVALTGDPKVCESAVELLEPVFREPGQGWQRVAVLEVLVECAGPEHRRLLRTELAALLESLGEVRQAFATRLRLVLERPEDLAARAEVERLARAGQLEEELLAAYEDLLDRRLEPRVASALRASIARLLLRLDRPALAIAAWEDVARAEPRSTEPLEALAGLHRQSGDALQLAAALRRLVPLLPGVPEQVATLRELALLWQDRLAQPAQATDAWRQIVERAPRDAEALRALARLQATLGKHDDAAKSLEQQLALTEDAGTAADLGLELAHLYLGPLGRPEQALAHFSRVLERRPGDAAAMQGLESLLSAKPELAAQAAARLEGPTRERHDSAKLASLLELQLQPADASRRKTLLEELAALREQAGDLAGAFTARRSTFELDPVPRNRADLERLADATGRHNELIDAFQARLRAHPAPNEAAELWRRIAQAYTRLAHRPGALHAWEEVAKLTPDDPAPLAALCDLHRAAGAYQPLVALYRRRAELEPSPDQQVTLLLELAELAEQKLRDPATAIDACRTALARAPSDARALEIQERLLQVNGRFGELAELLLERIRGAAAKGDEALELELRARWARVQHQALKNDSAALGVLMGILSRRPGEPHAVAVLEEMMRSGRPASGQAAEQLESHYAGRGEQPKLIDALEVRAEWAASAESRAQLLHRIAGLHESLGAPAGAFDALDRLLREVPGDARALERALTLAAAANTQPALVSLLTELSARVLPEHKAAVLTPLARLREGVGDAPGAIAAWRELIAVEPSHRVALESCSRLLETAGRWRELVELLEHRLRLEEDPALLEKIGALREDQLKDLEGAYVAFEQLQTLRPDDPEVLRRLDGLAERLERWPELAVILERRLAIDASQRGALSLRLARLRRERLGSGAGALPLLLEVLERDPDDARALDELAQLVADQPGWEPAQNVLLDAYRRRGELPKLIALLDGCAGLALTAEKRIALFTELAELRLTHDADAEAAFVAYAKAYRERPADDAMRARLIELGTQAHCHEALATLFEELLPRLEPGPAAEVSLVLGGLCEGALREPDRAVQHYRKALELDPRTSPRALANLQRVLEARGRWPELLPVLEAREREAPDAIARVGLLLKLATLCEDKLQHHSRAAQAYQSVLELEPKNLDAARALEAIYGRTGETEKLLATLEHLLEHVPREQRPEVRLKLARLYVTSAPDRAIALCRQMLADDPLHPEAFSLLADRLEAAARYPELAAALRSRLQLTLSPADAADLGFRLGEVTWRRLADPAGATAQFAAVLGRAPRHLGALEALRELYESLGQKRELAQTLARLVTVRSDPQLRRPYEVRRAEVLSELGDAAAAIDAARDALALGPNEAETGRLRALLLSREAWPEAAQALSLAAGFELEGKRVDKAVETLFQLAEVEQRRGNTEGATQALETILTHEPGRREAYDQARALYAGAQQWSSWATLTAKFLPHLTGTERLATLDELAERHEAQLLDGPGAYAWAEQAARLDPATPARRERLERLARSLHREAQWVKLYREILDGLAFGPAWTEIALTLATVEDEHLDHVDAAAKTLTRLLEHEPGNARALAALAKLYEKRGLFAKLASTLELELETAKSVPARAVLLERLAGLHEQQLQDPKAAAFALQRLFDLQHDVAHAGLLVALHQRHQQWPEAINMLLATRQLMTTAAERTRVQLQICELYETKLSDPEAAVAGYLQALEYEPPSPVAFRALERLYTQLKRPAELLRSYERRLLQIDDPKEKVELLFKSATLWEQRQERLRADRCLESITQLQPADPKAFEELARLRRIDQRYKPLTEVLARLVEVVRDALTRAELCTELAEVTLLHLHDTAAAARWWGKALDQVPEHRPALRGLAQLHQQEGRFADAVRLLDRDAALETSLPARAALEHQSGVLKEDRLRQPSAARDNYRRALVADPVYLPSLRRVRALFFKAGEWREYEANLEHEAMRAQLPVDRFASSIELAQHLRQRSHDAEGAIRWYEHALMQQPGALDASLPLADLLLAARHWPRAVGVLQGVAASLEAEKPPRRTELVTRLCQLGEATRQAGKPKQALAEWDRALALDATQPDALRGQFEVLDATGHSAEAAAKLELLLHHQPRAADRAALHTRLGELYWLLGKPVDALASAERALSVEASNVAALKLAVLSCDKQALFEKSVSYRQRLAGLVPEAERPQLLFELGVVAQDQLKKPPRAIEAFVASLALKPGEKRVLERLEVAYRDAGHNRKAAETLQAMLELPELSVNERRGHTLHLAELVSRSPAELDRAAAILERALDQDSTFADAFALLEKLLTHAKEFAKLDASFDRMVVRHGESPSTATARALLYRRLGELRLNTLKNRGHALAAFEQAARLLPTDVQSQEAFADLAMEFPERMPDAVAAYQRALPSTATPEKYRAASLKLAVRRGDQDTALLAARAAALLGTSAPSEQPLLDKWGPQSPVPPQFRAPVSDAGWTQSLLHPDARGPIGELMSFLHLEAGAKYAADLSDFKLHPKKHAIDLNGGAHPALRQLSLISRALGFEDLKVLSPYFAPQSSSKRVAHPDDGVSLKLYPTFPFTLVIGEKFFNEKNPATLAALIGSRLAYLRPELAVSQRAPDQLWLLFEAALSLVDEGRESSADPKMLKAEQKKLNKALSSNARALLPSRVRHYLKQARPDDLPRYIEGARQTPLRTALLVSGDFGATAKFFPEGQLAHGSLRQLLRFALGGDLHALRLATGTALVNAKA